MSKEVEEAIAYFRSHPHLKKAGRDLSFLNILVQEIDDLEDLVKELQEEHGW